MSNKTQTIILGGGCFWCLEAAFKQVPGIETVTSGYAGGDGINPTYELVQHGQSNHAEVVKIEFKPEKVSLAKILNIFFEIHDPTTLNRQGDDIGEQYRSIILTDSAQIQEVLSFIDTIRHNYLEKITTKVQEISNFYPAEDYHQNYFEKNPNQAYCKIVIAPKVQKARELSS